MAEEWRAGRFEIKPADEVREAGVGREGVAQRGGFSRGDGLRVRGRGARAQDIHTANERRLGELVGAVAGKLHTGRSRNDQVATDLRLWLRDEVSAVLEDLYGVLDVLVERAEAEVDFVMPGYTHLQPAQPVRWSHWLMAHAAALQRDAERFEEARGRMNRSPLGSGALAGHPFGVDRAALARDLGFSGPCPNSLDAVGDRDFVVDTLYAASLLSVHMSKLAEDLIIFSTAEFGFVKLSDAYSTGSSLMPQKKNPDALELIRGKSGRAIGALTGLLTTLKGLPSTYNKDLQEDKEPVFDVVQTLRKLLPITRGCIATLRVQPDKMRRSLWPEMLATDLADYLVRKGVPFRETHHVAGAAVKLAEDKGVALTDLTFADLKPLHKAFAEDVVRVWSFETSVEARNAVGGTAKSSVLAQTKALREWVRAARARQAPPPKP